MEPDQALMERVRAGDTEALEALIGRWRGRAEAYAAAILHDAHLAEDCVQEAFARVYAARMDYSPRYAFSTWLYVILRRICISELRRLRRAPVLFQPEELARWPVDSAEAEYLTRWEKNSRLMRLADLDRQERLLLLGQTVGGKSARELAQELGLTPGQVRVRLHRIRRRLRKGEEGEP